jgi:hypothetical protein
VSDLRLLARSFGETIVVVVFEIGNIPRRWWIAMLVLAIVGNAMAVLLS